ncbi:heme-binding domain-containing protein [uncultured Imperialibacter sp.]|uniref:heme-binding domain-containing protein n=1 Tax=uncultured Imperialibacter sp. TaxID=1672639 RepID=UPI0030DA8BB8|tara:strand:+ start:708 stop:1112 length:405 start_codon:yes stop_codon:yes gene_type:complete
MKKFTLLAGALLLFAASGMAQEKEPTKILLVPEADAGKTVAFTLEAMSVIEAKCLGCHSPSGKSDKAKEKMQWEKLQTLSGADAMAKLDEILEVLDKGEMPPAKMVEKYPNMKLTEEESAKLHKWAEAALAKLE